MRSTPNAFHAFAALLAACGCCAPKAPAPLNAGKGVGGTGMAVVGSSQTRVVDFDYTGRRNFFQVPDKFYPEAARQAKIEGMLEVEISISANGEPISVEILSGPEIFHQSTRAYIFSMTFKEGHFIGKLPTKIKRNVFFRL